MSTSGALMPHQGEAPPARPAGRERAATGPAGRFDRRVFLLAPAVLLLIVAFVSPVGLLLSRAFTQPQVGLQNFADLWERRGFLQVLWNTVMISATATPICVLLGFPVAHAMTHGSARLRRWLIFIVLVPFWTSLLVRTFANVILLQRNGPLNTMLVGLGLSAEPLPLLYNMTGLLVGAVQVLLPFVIFPLHAAMLRIDPAYMQAALTLGAGPIRAFWRVYLPLTMPGLLTGATLVFISTLGYYVTPAMLGGPRQTMIAQLIQDQIAQFGNWGMAGALSLLLLAVSGVMLLLLQLTVGLKAVAR
ncbi:ABC transporter permease [Phreatobacter stygius]|uniref:ABC transporter permease n=1 Tax=Phreatobacter stygius TaxID=1940610 RepID=A0A4D7BAG9_9HYPH|nr:ABC transporter permease [Phreatobacter stygius]QCI67630.1 ABC transporter permease [Phreatobacter stygius]